MKTTSILSVVAVCLLAQCNKAEQGSAASSKETSPTLPVITTHASPHFMEVAQYLELGGAYFNYAEQNRLMETIAVMLDDGLKNLPVEQRKGLPANFSVVKLFNDLGLNDVKALGSSSHLKSSGIYHSRTFARTPSGRKGLMTLNGGPAEPFLTLQIAPKGTDLALEFPLHLKTIAKESLVNFLAMVPKAARANVEAPLNEQVPMLGISTRELVEKLDARLGFFVKVYPDQQLPLPNVEVPLPGLDVMIVADRVGWMLEPLKKQFLPMLNNSMMPVKVVDEDGVLTIVFKEPVGPAPADFQPMLRFDSKTDRLMLATRASFMQQALDGNDLLTTSPEFKVAWEGMPEEGNAAVYLSPVLLKTLQSLAKLGIKDSKESTETKRMMNNVVELLTPYLGNGQAACMTNLPNGTLGMANLALPLSNNSALSTLTTISIISSLAVPTFNTIQVKANQQKITRQGREIYIALQNYAADNNGLFPPTLNDLKGVDELMSKYGSHPWLYNSQLSTYSPSTSIILASEIFPGETRCVVTLDGLVSIIKEENFQKQKDENLIQR